MCRPVPGMRLSLLFLLAAACQLPAGRGTERADPSQGEVPLPAAPGWRAVLATDLGETGIWTVKPLDLLPAYAGAEVVACADDGRLLVLVPYSGRWTRFEAVHDPGGWLGGLDLADLDPRLPGPEIYTGSASGNLWQVFAHPDGQLESRRIARIPGHEIHTVLCGELDAAHPGPEALVFTSPGGIWRVAPAEGFPGFETRRLDATPGRIRDARLLPAAPGEAPWIALASRAGRLELLRLGSGGLERRTVFETTAGLGRLAVGSAGPAGPWVLYSTCDDGRILRHEGRPEQGWRTETVLVLAPGPRGVAAGPFTEDPGEETLAVFGYDARVRLLRRGAGGWRETPVFTDRDRGHWLSAAELDGRNGTRELLLCGYGGRVVLLARPPGYGLPEGVPVAGGASPAQAGSGGRP